MLVRKSVATPDSRPRSESIWKGEGLALKDGVNHGESDEKTKQ